ncbi:MAG: hypothetical protein MPI95_04305 [Nitrosopumilus sp.]|nr:hypothetical protein [Nitrosopumilus sp.]CAI9831593.1 conserved hypothetical protein [Nitrosopumilaceae archaeon]MDA7941559.1 hypothetical protein [Nitrosopumilus sp.]MDA7943588.1 hypothetical protein [Nitrosopumilus sp.]MDA7945050.1 hypothetical protein [Nitrosopumilus sp.]
MPKEGFKSITVSESVYDRFYDTYAKSKKALSKKGVNSFAGYVTYMLEDAMEKDRILARHAPLMESISVDGEMIVIKDNGKKRIAEVTVRNDKLYCQLCEKGDCVHIGFAFSLPEVHEAMSSRGVRNPR